MKYTHFLLALVLLGSCKEKKDRSMQFARASQFEDKNIVVTDFAASKEFFREYESNGILEAQNKAILHYELNEQIESVQVENGTQVTKGKVLSTLSRVEHEHNYNKAVRNLEKSRLELEDALITMGYQLKDSASVPEQVMKIALIRSGYSDALSYMEMAQITFDKTKIVAPFAGLIADLKAKPQNNSSLYKSFCTLIDASTFEVHFPLLESEAFKITPGIEVMVVPYAFDRDTLVGRLSSVNPHVDETGMVEVTAVIKNRTKRLAEGMNVKVIVRESIGTKIVVPKSAVTLRQERKVVFVCKNDTAHWRYVNVGEENSHYCTITNKGVKPGEEIVVDGNFNLAHLVPVEKLK